MDDLPSSYADGETKPAPMPLLLVQVFVNTRDFEAGTDVLDDPDSARAWLVDIGLLDPKAPLTAAEVDQARGVREAIRGLLVANGADGEGPDLEPIRSVTGSHLARLTVGAHGVLGFECAEEGSLGCGLFDLLLVLREAQRDGTWARLKACANPECHWVFYDRSRNQQGNWCDMAVCGNRLKNRELRARRR